MRRSPPCGRAFPRWTGEAERRRAIAETAHVLEPAALCLSGGGMRSAAFALGVIQALARCDLLTRFDYLSTVSGRRIHRLVAGGLAPLG